MNIGIPINSNQKGLLVSLGKELESRGHQVFYIARDYNVCKVIRKLLPTSKYKEPTARIDIKEWFALPVGTDIIDQCLKREKQYGETFSMLASYDRGLGKGYLYNADNHPDIGKAWWSKERKFAEILRDFYYYEYVIEKFNLDRVIGLVQSKVLALVCRYWDIPYVTIAAPRYGGRFYWVDNEHEQSLNLVGLVRKYVDELFCTDFNFSNIQLKQTECSQYVFSKINYSYSAAIKKATHSVLVQSYQRIRGIQKRDSYKFAGWVRPLLQKPYIYKYFLRHGKTPQDLKGSRIVLFPLQVEPEISLIALSPEFNNSLEAITWISKSLPTDVYLVVKEHPNAFGVRSKRYWNNLRRMPNVVLAHPKVSSLEWLDRCSLVATITGTMGYEAVYMGRPVLSFGKHQLINELPTVKYTDRFKLTRTGINELLRIKTDSRLFQISRKALDRAQAEYSFHLPDFEAIVYSEKLHMDLAKTAIDNLWSEKIKN